MTASSRPETAPMIRTERRGDVLLATIDMPGRTMNVFSWGLMDELEALLDQIARDAAIRAFVLTSGKETFLAGADLEMVRGFTDAGTTMPRARQAEICGRLGRLFVRLEALPKPSVAAINGLALGGGLELSMACHARVAADDPRIQLGLPEIRLGLLPGAGGTQRMPRLVGFEKGMELLLNGKAVAPAEALEIGLVDEVLPRADIVTRALALAADLARKGAPSPIPSTLDPGAFDIKAPDAVRRMTRHFGYADEMVARYPAYDAIVRSVIEGAALPLKAGTDTEMERFVDLMQDEVAGNMVKALFLDRQKADKLVQQFRDLRDARFAVAAEGPAAEALRASLAAAKAQLVPVEQAAPGDIVIASSTSPASAIADLVLLSGTERIEQGVGFFLARSKAYGTAIEIVVTDEAEPGVDKALALARQLRATPYVHQGTQALLAALIDAAARARAAGLPEEAVIAAQAATARKLAAEGAIGDPGMADVAAVAGGAFPAFAGGPFTWLARHGGDLARLRTLHGAQAPGLRD